MRLGLLRCSPISRATMSRSPCATAPARKSAWSGCITSACRRTRSKSWRRRAPTPCRCMMPYIDAFFMPRATGDRPEVVPKGAVNFAFLGQFAETARDTIFTTEYSMRTGMEAVYTLLNVDRGVPEVWGSTYDHARFAQRHRAAARRQEDHRYGTSCSSRRLALKEVLKKIQGTRHREVPEGIQCHLMLSNRVGAGAWLRAFLRGGRWRKNAGALPQVRKTRIVALSSACGRRAPCDFRFPPC